MSKRATRRHHRRRVIKKFERITQHWYWSGTKDEQEQNIKRTASRGSIGCGCAMCANPRRRHSVESGRITRREQENLLYYKNWNREY